MKAVEEKAGVAAGFLLAVVRLLVLQGVGPGSFRKSLFQHLLR